MFRRYGADTKYKGKSEDFVDVFLFFFLGGGGGGSLQNWIIFGCHFYVCKGIF